MALSKNSFFLGLAVGVALAMLTLDVLGRYLEQRRASASQVHLLRPFQPQIEPTFPRPRLPGTSSQQHDDWQLRPLDGSPVTLSEFKNKAVFLNFWSTSCAPCVAEMPSIERLYHSVKNERVTFLAVTQDDEKQVRSFLKSKPLSVPVYLVGKDTPQDLQVDGMPITYILDSNGAVAFSHVGPLNWDSENARTYLRRLAPKAHALSLGYSQDWCGWGNFSMGCAAPISTRHLATPAAML